MTNSKTSDDISRKLAQVVIYLSSLPRCSFGNCFNDAATMPMMPPMKVTIVGCGFPHHLYDPPPIICPRILDRIFNSSDLHQMTMNCGPDARRPVVHLVRKRHVFGDGLVISCGGRGVAATLCSRLELLTDIWGVHGSGIVRQEACQQRHGKSSL